MGWEESGIFSLIRFDGHVEFNEGFGRRLCLGDSSMVCSLYYIAESQIRDFVAERKTKWLRMASISQWVNFPVEWPNIRALAMPLPVSEIAALVSPPQIGEGSGMLDRTIIQDVPAPPPSRPLVLGTFKIPNSG